MSSWRPEKGWNKRRTGYLSDVDNSYLGCTVEAKRIYEAGADAMLEALKAEGAQVKSDKTMDWERALHRIRANTGPGHLIFIPEMQP